MIKAGIIGATGYAGAELARILSRHPDVKLVSLGSKSYAGEPYAEIYQNMRGTADDICGGEDMEKLADEADVIFTATPQGYCCAHISEEILRKAKVIDLSADFRLKDAGVYEKWYGQKQLAPQFLGEAVYGLCELFRDRVKDARLTANPGCYTTCGILTLYPLVKEGVIDADSIIIDAKSGTSGAGRGLKTGSLFCEVNENIKAYGVTTHRHTPEIEEQLGYAAGRKIVISFTPHLVPMQRGILVTAYANLTRPLSYGEIRKVYEKYYGGETFIRLLPEGVFPETRWVKGSNYTDIGFTPDARTGRVIAAGALDNLIKGAAGQAVQNMNLMFGLSETAGIDFVPAFP